MLAAKVAARNKVHATLLAKAPALFALAKSFNGRKVYKVTGDFTKEFAEAAKAITGALQGYWNRGLYSLSFSFKVCEQGPRSCTYAEATLYIADISGAILEMGEYETHFKPESFRIDYTEDEVRKARHEVKAAREAVREIERRFDYFGEHDNG